jgi:hypothetical protein
MNIGLYMQHVANKAIIVIGILRTQSYSYDLAGEQ